MSSHKKQAAKLAIILLSVSLLAVTIYRTVPQVKENQPSTSVTSPSSTSEAAAYWWQMLHAMTNASAKRTTNPASTAPTTTQGAPTTNQTLWVHGAGAASSKLAVGDGVVFIVNKDKAIFALNASTGGLVWFNVSDYVGSPTFGDHKLFVGSADNTVRALDASTGALLWSYPTGNIADSGPVFADGVVYAGSGNGPSFYALNADTGTLVWNYTTDGPVWSSPAVADGVVYVGTVDHGIYALNASTGAVIWISSSNIWLLHSVPAVADGVLYAGSWTAHLYAVNASTGAIIWGYQVGYGVYSSPAVADGVVYVGAIDGNVYAVNASTGTQVWNFTTGDFVMSSPAVADGVVYVGSWDHNFYALNASTGLLVWSYTTGGWVESSPAVDNYVVYVASDDGNTYAFGEPPFSVAISPSSVEMDVGQPQLFSSHVRGGAPPYTFQWYLDDAPVSEATDASWTFTPASEGVYTVHLQVTDSLGTLLTSASATVVAAVPPVFSILNPGPESNESAWNASQTVRYMGTPEFTFYTNETSLGSTFFVNITVTNATDLYAWGIGLVYDNTSLQFVSAWLPADHVFSQAEASGDTLVPCPAVVDTWPYNRSYAIVKWGCTYIRGSQDWSFNGSGTLGQIEFKIIRAPSSTTPQLTSVFTFDRDWTTTIYWPDLDYRPEPLLGTASYTYTS